MFTGIVVAMGTIAARADNGGDVELAIDAATLDLARAALGDSISVQGVCLTLTRKQGSRFFADVSRETLSKTTLGALETGARVNLEPSLRVGDQLGGHLVSGHVDGVGELMEVVADARSWRMRFGLPAPLSRFVAKKGSICIDGVSLTVNEIAGASFDVNIIPHTFRETTLGDLVAGAAVNLEIDLVARYLERLASFGKTLP